MTATPSMVMIYRPYLAELRNEAARAEDPRDPQLLNEALEYAAKALEAVPAAEAEAAGMQPAEPPPPPGDYGTVHVMGHEQREGWVSDGSIAGATCLDVKDEAGRLIAKIPPHSVYMFEPGLPPQALASLRRPGPLAALPAGDSDPWAGEDDGGPRACDCGPGERCFECATDDEAAVAIPPRVGDGSPF